jgi:hypothetical protein
MRSIICRYRRDGDASASPFFIKRQNVTRSAVIVEQNRAKDFVQLSNAVVVITGVGIGRVLAQGFSRDGAFHGFRSARTESGRDR